MTTAQSEGGNQLSILGEQIIFVHPNIILKLFCAPAPAIATAPLTSHFLWLTSNINYPFKCFAITHIRPFWFKLQFKISQNIFSDPVKKITVAKKSISTTLFRLTCLIIFTFRNPYCIDKMHCCRPLINPISVVIRVAFFLDVRTKSLSSFHETRMRLKD